MMIRTIHPLLTRRTMTKRTRTTMTKTARVKTKKIKIRKTRTTKIVSVSWGRRKIRRRTRKPTKGTPLPSPAKRYKTFGSKLRPQRLTDCLVRPCSRSMILENISTLQKTTKSSTASSMFGMVNRTIGKESSVIRRRRSSMKKNHRSVSQHSVATMDTPSRSRPWSRMLRSKTQTSSSSQVTRSMKRTVDTASFVVQWKLPCWITYVSGTCLVGRGVTF
mmetsp:Transcript_54361/g.131946  ORF Transcript_54361/g.131946 Transcript_54361/m.131946 type:complete len:219 (+) Transcript_54361:52-708(+)